MTSVREKLSSVKSSVRIVDVLKINGVVVPENTESQISCPFHGVDAHPSARVYTSTNTIYCWTCRRLWDVIAADMEFSGRTLAESVDFLVSEFDVEVSSQPQEIVRFYTSAVKYQRGDVKHASNVVNDLADRFRKYYMSSVDWLLLEPTIDYLWRDFDQITTLKLNEIAPIDLQDAVVDWYARACSMVASQLPTVLMLHPSEDSIAMVEQEED